MFRQPAGSHSNEDDFLGLTNETMTESLMQGSIVKIEHSPFLDLYPDFGRDTKVFLDIAGSQPSPA